MSDPIIKQTIRSATSVGANFAEAKNSGSPKDFRNKVLISKKECAETQYWLQVLVEFKDNDELLRLTKECHEINLILQKIINTLAAKH